MEGCALGIRQNFEVFTQAGWEVGEVRIQGGAARSPVWNQIISDVVDRPVLVPPACSSASVGNAILAGLATGVFPDVATALAACARAPRCVSARPSRRALYDRLYPIYLDVYRQLAGSFQDLAAFRHLAGQAA